MATVRRRAFLAAAAAGSVAVGFPAAAAEPAADTATAKSLGPLLGHLDTVRANVWFRASTEGRVELRVTGNDAEPRVVSADALAEHDLCVTWTVDGLQPDRKYTAEVLPGKAAGDAVGRPCVIHTTPDPGTPAKVQLAFGSCASSTKFFAIWDRIAETGADGVVLLGDTPYIDRTDLPSNRQAHRQFLSIPNLAELIRTRPLWATWDDHDFGANDSDGTIKGKRQIRQAFCEYRALANFGDGDEGIYTKFRYGPVEVFLLDPRYFSQTEPSPVDPEKNTCLGRKQWQWLLDGLERSTAAFKLLATGMIWDDKKNKEKDDWETYAHEREALYDFIAAKRISGVMLIGGDIHVSRRLTYPMKARWGYDLHQSIISPLHDRIIPGLNVPHPALVWGEPIPNVFLQMTADSTSSPATLRFDWIDIHGKKLHSLAVTAEELAAKRD